MQNVSPIFRKLYQFMKKQSKWRGKDATCFSFGDASLAPKRSIRKDYVITGKRRSNEWDEYVGLICLPPACPPRPVHLVCFYHLVEVRGGGRRAGGKEVEQRKRDKDNGVI